MTNIFLFVSGSIILFFLEGKDPEKEQLPSILAEGRVLASTGGHLATYGMTQNIKELPASDFHRVYFHEATIGSKIPHTSTTYLTT